MTMLGQTGAEQLLGKGDMLFKHGGIKNIQGAYIDEDDIAAYLKEHMCTSGDSNYIITIPKSSEEEEGHVSGSSSENEFDKNLAKTIILLLKQKKISNDEVQGLAEVGYHSANKYMRRLEQYSLIPPLNRRRAPRKLIPVRFEDMPNEVIEFLMQHNYTIDKIQDNFS